MQTDKNRCVVFVSLTGDEQIKCYDMDPDSGALQLRSTVTPTDLQVLSVCTRLER